MERLWFIANLAEVLVERDDFSLVRMHARPATSRRCTSTSTRTRASTCSRAR